MSLPPTFDLDALEAVARLAVDGPWHWRVLKLKNASGYTVIELAHGGCAADDTKFIAAASPDVVLALIARVRAAEALADRLATVASEAFGPFPVQTAEEGLTAIERGAFAARQEGERLRGELAVTRRALIRLLWRSVHDDAECTCVPGDVCPECEAMGALGLGRWQGAAFAQVDLAALESTP